jgi:hypothetical protein
VILHRTLVYLGHRPDALQVHLLAKGTSPHDSSERERMRAHDVHYAIFCDHGSRGGPALIPPHMPTSEPVKTLLLDHHLSAEFPEDTLVLSAAQHEPIATSAALAFVLCAPLLDIRWREKCEYLCAMGTHGDLGTSFKWEAPWPDMTACFKQHTKKAVNDAVSLINARM